MTATIAVDRIIDPTELYRSRGLRYKLRGIWQDLKLSLFLPPTVGSVKLRWRERAVEARGKTIGAFVSTVVLFLGILFLTVIPKFNGELQDYASLAIIGAGLAFNVWSYRRRAFRAYTLVAAVADGDSLTLQVQEGQLYWLYLDRQALPAWWESVQANEFPLKRVEAWFAAESSAMSQGRATELQATMVSHAQRMGAFHPSSK